ncbi:L,D-transpeptidase family protein [Streptomyces sp. NPDC049597]|uniref:L,D-transpeptidase family protein n=1 Tax=Streptomyces sp. NPDC049597 TaxID=3155276 RepID=UPI00343472CD
MLRSSRRYASVFAVVGAMSLLSACGDQEPAGSASSVAPGASQGEHESKDASASASPSPSVSASASASASPSASASASAKASGSATPTATASGAKGGSGSGSGEQTTAPSAPDFPVPVNVGNATQIITVKASGSYATVTAWQKGSAGWKAQFSTSAGRVGSNGVTDGATRRQSTYTTPTGTYTITEGFGVESSGTAMPYTKVNDSHWWVQDPESKYYNQMHTAEGADFPLTESGERGSEHLINYPTQYAKALVINFNRWPAVPGRGAGIFLHVNGKGATAGCVSVPRATMDRFMGWVKPSANPRIAIG